MGILVVTFCNYTLFFFKCLVPLSFLHNLSLGTDAFQYTYGILFISRHIVVVHLTSGR